MTEPLQTAGYVLVNSCVYCADLRGTGTSAATFIEGVERVNFILLVPEVVKDEVINYFSQALSSTNVKYTWGSNGEDWVHNTSKKPTPRTNNLSFHSLYRFPTLFFKCFSLLFSGANAPFLVEGSFVSLNNCLRLD